MGEYYGREGGEEDEEGSRARFLRGGIRNSPPPSLVVRGRGLPNALEGMGHIVEERETNGRGHCCPVKEMRAFTK